VNKEVAMAFSSHRWLAAPLAVLALSAPSRTLAGADVTCKKVEGFLEEKLVTAGCTSPVGLCTVARMFGHLKGEARFTAAAITPSADTPATSVVFVTGDTLVVDAEMESKRGTLTIKNAAAFRTTGVGDLADNQTIIAGTDDFAGATGSLRISGNFVGDSGTSKFEGNVCVP
jgi:hypothetical protein